MLDVSNELFRIHNISMAKYVRHGLPTSDNEQKKEKSE